MDDYTRFKVVKFVKKKSDTTAALLSMVADYITPQKLSIKCIRTDNGGEFEGEFRRELDRRSITHEHTPPDTPQYNGVAERALGLLREKAIILMEELDDVINVPREKLWAQARLFACDVTNKSTTTSTNEGKSPYELWFGKSPTAYHLRPFGTVGYARQSVREHKMAPKGEKCVFMGIPRNVPTGTVSVLLVRSRNIVEKQAVQWIDGPKKTGRDDRGMKPAGGDIIVERGTPQLNVQELGQEQHEHEWQETISELEGETQGALSDHGEDTQEVLSEDEREQQHEEGGAEARSASLEGPTVPALRKLTIDGNVPPILSSRTRSRKPYTGVEGGALHCFLPAIEAEEENGVEDVLACDDGGQMAMQATLDVSEPRNRRQVMESHEWDEWRKAEETERLGMVENCVYDQVARPKDKLVIGTKMLYKPKIGQDGKVEKYKCRLVAQGFWQVEGVHYTEKYSPTPSAASIRMLLATAAAKGGELRHFDAEQAFLKADIDEEIYIEIPEEFQKFPGAVGRLNKAIYGFVQAGRCWNNKFCDDMTAIGFEQAKVDPCVFRKVVDGEAEMVVVVHVDDILAHAKDQATMNRFAAELGRKFKLKDMGEAEYYMGCHITRNRKARKLKFDQHLYVESMVKRFNVKKEAKIPAASGVQTLSKVDEPQNPEEKEEMKMFPYREAVGALMWAATMARPDIACAVRAVARFCKNPGLAHMKAVMKIFQYLLHTKEWGITYGGQGCGLCMEAYTDSDFGACLDTRRSVSGAVLMLAKGAISWHSRMQEVTAAGTSEAEYVALSEVVKDVLFLRQVQEFMETSMRVGAVNVFEDNEGAIKLATNKHASRRTKHIDVKHHLVRDASDAQRVRVAYVRSEDQHADLLTKPLDVKKFCKHAKFILNVVGFDEVFFLCGQVVRMSSRE